MELCRRLLVLTAVTLGLAMPARAQSRGYVGGTVSLMVQPQAATTVTVGGTTWSGSVVAGVKMSRRWSVEFEPSFAGGLAAETYTYRPSPSLQAEVVSRVRDTFLTIQLRGRAGVLEPVAGLSYVRSSVDRHASFVPDGRTYFDDASSHGAIALAGGLDATWARTSRFAIVPTFRVFVVRRQSPSLPDVPVSGHAVVVRAGIGARVSL